MAPDANQDVMLSPDAVISGAGTMLHELLAFRDTFDRLYHEPLPGSAAYGNLNADMTVAAASARFIADAVAQGRAQLDQVIDVTTKVIEFAVAMADSSQATAARMAAIVRGSHGG